MGNSESGNAATNAGHGQLAVVLNRLEQNIGDSLAGIESSFSRLANTLETTLQRLETKLNAVRKTLKLLPDHLKENGNAAGRALKKAEKFGLRGGSILGEWVNLIPPDPEDHEKVRGFYNEDSDKLSARFRTHERDIAAYRSDPDTVTAQEDIANSYHEQELILAALIKKAEVHKVKIDRLRSGGLIDSDDFRGNLQSLNRIIDALETIRDLATGPKLQEFIDVNLPIFRGPTPFFGEGGEPQAGGRVRPLSLGRRSGFSGGSGDDILFGGAGSETLRNTLRNTLRDLGVTTEDTEGNFTGLNDAVERYKDSIGTLATGLAETNTQLGGQADWLTTVGGLLPGVGRQITDLFDSGVAGAEGLDRAVAAMGTRFLGAFEGAILRGESLGDTLKSLGRDLANLALNEVKTGGLNGLFDILGGLFSPNAKGNVFERGRSLTGFARGGALTNAIVNRPTLFPMADGAGLMGESGPEAVLPLTRLANGDLGVSMPGAPPAAAGPNITYNIDARGADREGLNRLTSAIRQLDGKVNYLDRTMDRRAVGAMAYARGRGGNIARAFGGW